MEIVLEWDGVDVPEELRELPKGRYVVVPIDEARPLTLDEEAGLEAALTSARGGRTMSAADARARVNERFGR